MRGPRRLSTKRTWTRTVWFQPTPLHGRRLPGENLIQLVAVVSTHTLVVNGAFNQGNSGGPLFKAADDKVIGIVVSKHAPLSHLEMSALDALANNRSGVVFPATQGDGTQVKFVESQIVHQLLMHFQDLAQVMIGEAICVSELKAFLTGTGIPLPDNSH